MISANCFGYCLLCHELIACCVAVVRIGCHGERQKGNTVVPGTTSTGITWVFSGILKDGTWNPIEYGLTSSVRRR
jgi:hypothetical protein